jgi:hypothetical protein
LAVLAAHQAANAAASGGAWGGLEDRRDASSGLPGSRSRSGGGGKKSQARAAVPKRSREVSLPFGPTGPDGKRAKAASVPVRPSNWSSAQDRRLCEIVSAHGAREWKNVAARMREADPAAATAEAASARVSSSSSSGNSGNSGNSSGSSGSSSGSSGDGVGSASGGVAAEWAADDGSGDFTDVQCLHRWNKVLKPGLKKGPWTEEEDSVVAGAVAMHGADMVRLL